MAGANSTGKADTSDYTLGRGKVYFANKNADGTPDTYRFLGNAPEFTINVEVETLEHQSSQAGLKTTDKEVTISQSAGLTVTLDEINFDNLAVFFSGTASTPNNSVGGFIDSQLADSVVLGRWYDIFDKSATPVRVYDITAAANISFGTTAATMELVLDTDYEVDLIMGRVFLLSDAVNIVATNDLFCTYVETTGEAATVDQVEALTQTSVDGALKFIQINPTDADHQTEYQFHSVSLKAEGDFSLVGDDWTTMQLSGKAESSTGTSARVTGKTLTVTTHADA